MATRDTTQQGNDTGSTPSQILRRSKRADALKQIINLKRRCIRCYFVNVFAATFQLSYHVDTLSTNYALISQQPDLLCAIVLFVVATFTMIVGSVLCIYAMSKKLRKWAFLLGNSIMLSAIFMNAMAAFGESVFPPGPNTIYGYPRDLLEDCEAYPDHTFKFITSPASRKGQPVLEDEEEDEEDSQNEFFTTTTELIVTESYSCDVMLTNVQWFQQAYKCMTSLLIVTVITVTLSYICVCQLYFIHRKGSGYSILPPALVQPYEMYDELMKKNQSTTSINTESNTKVSTKVHENKRQEFIKRNKEFQLPP